MAEYILFSLISSINLTKDGINYGKIILNLYKCPVSNDT